MRTLQLRNLNLSWLIRDDVDIFFFAIKLYSVVLGKAIWVCKAFWIDVDIDRDRS
jgi:hypothetical protein